MLIAVGGDGTLQLLVNEVLGQNVQVGVIPAGGGNDFAAALGITKNVEKASRSNCARKKLARWI